MVDFEGAREVLDAVVAEVSRVVVEKEGVLRMVLAVMSAGGHVLIEDVPGVAKTLMAKSIARTMSLAFSRIQFTPDLLPADITGTHVFDRRTGEFRFVEGPVFANLVLGDEINRAPPKTQSALLEAMQEGQVTVEGETRPLPRPFVVIATQNPIEFEGTYPLPAAQLDRFMARIRVGYPSEDGEVEVIGRRIRRGREEADLRTVADGGDFETIRAAVEAVRVEEPVARYAVRVIRRLRDSPEVELGPSPRAAVHLILLSRALALQDGRDYVIPDDVKRAAVPALAHRIMLRREVWYTKETQEAVVRRVLDSVEVPPIG